MNVQYLLEILTYIKDRFGICTLYLFYYDCHFSSYFFIDLSALVPNEMIHFLSMNFTHLQVFNSELEEINAACFVDLWLQTVTGKYFARDLSKVDGRLNCCAHQLHVHVRGNLWRH